MDVTVKKVFITHSIVWKWSDDIFLFIWRNIWKIVTQAQLREERPLLGYLKQRNSPTRLRALPDTRPTVLPLWLPGDQLHDGRTYLDYRTATILPLVNSFTWIKLPQRENHQNYHGLIHSPVVVKIFFEVAHIITQTDYNIGIDDNLH